MTVMGSLRARGILAAVALSLAAGPAGATQRTDTVFDGVTADELGAVMEANGYPVEIGRDDYGDPIIYSGVNSVDFIVEFYGCDGERTETCTELQFKVGFDMPYGTTWDVINAWNFNGAASEASLDDEADPWLAWFVVVGGGVTDEQLAATLSGWAAHTREFMNFIGFNPMV